MQYKRNDKVELSISDVILEVQNRYVPEQQINIGREVGAIRFLLNGYEMYMKYSEFEEFADAYQKLKK